MRALIYPAPDQAEVIEAERPTAGPGEVLLRSRVVGVCHSDLELLAGRYIIPIGYPITPGHEWAAEVTETGPGVDDLKPGDPVVGECVVGPGGRDHFGFSISGAAAEYFTARAEWLHKLPGHLTFTQGALVEPFSVAYAAVRAGVIDPTAGDLPGQYLAAQAREATDGELFDVVIESAGHPEAMAQALTLAGNHGRVVYVGIDVGSTIPAELGLIQARS